MMVDLKKLDWLVEALACFAKDKGITRKQAFEYANKYGGFDFINRHYEVEHQLSFEDTIDDINAIALRNGGNL
jgi:hypothetical protein